jgi:sphingomyelin phosphodiesterase acid-like 3
LRTSLYRAANIVVLVAFCTTAWCAPKPRRSPPARTDVVMLSDLHFDPFYDPAKFPELRRAPLTEWPAILSKPDSSTRVSTFSQLQSGCGVRGTDSPWPLVYSALREAKHQQPAPMFVTVSGDLLAHGFICKFGKLDPSATPSEASAFAAKTVAFLAQQLRAAYPSAPIYVALGNNDSGCADYSETPHSAFLKSAAISAAAGIHDPAARASLASTFPRLGDYSVMLPAPMNNTRLIVLQDIFESAHYRGCNNEPNAAPAAEQIAWLRAQLTEARASGQQVWVMAHIPPGVDVYTTYHRYLFAPGEACNVRQPQMFLSSNALGESIAEFGDIVRLAVFAHTHMDEIKLLHGPDDKAVPAKMVPSISPINGNDPSFIVAKVIPQTATIKDYEVYSATNAQGAVWNREYRYSDAYHLPDFSAKSVDQLTIALIDDKSGEDETSRVYERYFLSGGGTIAALGLQRLWPAYSCSLRELEPTAFRRCMCPQAPAQPSAAPATP